MVESWLTDSLSDGAVLWSIHELDTLVVCPLKVVTKLNDCNFLLLHHVENIWERLVNLISCIGFNHLQLWKHILLVKRTILGVHGEHEISLESCLLDWESLESKWKSMGTKFFLPLSKVSSLNGWHGILLLPVSQIVSLSLWVESEHECLHGEDVVGDKWRLEVCL